MKNDSKTIDLSEAAYIEELLSQLEEPVHKRLIQAYGGSNPVQSMEAELRHIITEVLHSED
jgi:hypothetical protein